MAVLKTRCLPATATACISARVMLPAQKHEIIEEARAYTGKKFHGVRKARRAIATAVRKGREKLPNDGYFPADSARSKTPEQRAEAAAAKTATAEASQS